MRWLLASLLLLLAGCHSAEKVKNGVLKWKYFREIDGYEVTVYIQRNENGLCLLRDVIMHFRVGTRFDSDLAPPANYRFTATLNTRGKK